MDSEKRTRDHHTRADEDGEDLVRGALLTARLLVHHIEPLYHAGIAVLDGIFGADGTQECTQTALNSHLLRA